jgi:hypothetical protein
MLPPRGGITLAPPLTRRHRGRVEIEEPRLQAGITVDSQLVIVLPRNAKPRRYSHNRSSSVRLELIARGFVGHWIPRISDLPRLFSHEHGLVIAFTGRDHPETPVFSYDSDPNNPSYPSAPRPLPWPSLSRCGPGLPRAAVGRQIGG